MTADIFTFKKGTAMTHIDRPCDTEHETDQEQAERAVWQAQEAIAALFELDPKVLAGVGQKIEMPFHGGKREGTIGFFGIMTAMEQDCRKLIVKVNNHKDTL